MLDMALKNIWGRKTRTILTIVGIVVAMQLYIILSTIMQSYEKDVQKQISAMAGRVTVQAKTDGVPSLIPLENVIKQEDAKAVEALEGVDVESSSMALFQAVVASNVPNSPPAVMAVGLEQGKEEAYFGNIEVKGSSHLNGVHDVILGSNAAEWALQEFNAKLGDSLTLRDEKFNIIGILPDINSVINASVIIPLATAQNIFVRPNVVSAVMLTAQKADKVDILAKKITDLNSKLVASTSNGVKKSADAMLSGQRMFFAMINDTIVVVAAFIIMIVMVMAVFERKKEIGTLKAIGASRSKILRMIVTESLVLSIIAGVVAMPASMVFTRILTNQWFFDSGMWLQTLIIVVILGVVSGLFPAWSAQRVNPLESLRYE